jgi:hypothetical protein
MAVYSRQIATALRIIKAKGERCLWASRSAPTADPDKPWLSTPGTEVTYPDTPLVFFPLSRLWSDLLGYTKGTEVVSGSTYGIMPAVSFSPQLTDIVTRTDGSTLAPLSIEPLAPNGEVILYTIEFRK